MMRTMRRAFARGLGHGSRRPPLSGTPPRGRFVRAPHLHEDLLEEAYVRRGTAERGPAHEDERVEDVLVRRADELRGEGLLRGVGVGSLSERKRTGPRAGPEGDDDARARERPGACLGLARRGLGVRAGGVAGVLGGHHRERRDGGSGGRTRRARSKRRGRLLFLSLGTPVGAALGRTETEQAPRGERNARRKRQREPGRSREPSIEGSLLPPARAPVRLLAVASPPRVHRRPCPHPRARHSASQSANGPPRDLARAPPTAPRPRRRRPRPARRRVRETSRVSPSALAIDRSPHAHHDRTALSRRPPPCPPRPNPRSPRTCTPSSASPRRRRPRRSAARTATSSPRRVREGSIPASFRDRPERDRSPSSRGPPPPLPRPEP